ncbi:hypothetical protein SUSAZ_08115 [Sulfolobus acidocaldarius SUSAZ]|nr:hypothetical protein SUSAZ_08115 [Sulfolobus acidocaldarius SUSAZ]
MYLHLKGTILGTTAPMYAKTVSVIYFTIFWDFSYNKIYFSYKRMKASPFRAGRKSDGR